MKAIKSLLAVSILAAAGAVNASTIGAGNVGFYSELGGVETVIGSGYFILDSSGTMTLTYTVKTTVLGSSVMSMNYTDTLTGTVAAGEFTATGGYSTATGCTSLSGTNYCAFAMSPQTNTFTAVSGSVGLSIGYPGTINASYYAPAGLNNYTYSFGPAVPIPAAAWLFGSGLAGLAGAARRRKANAV